MFRVHGYGNNQVSILYCLPERIAKHGSYEIISCLHHLPDRLTNLYLHSDGCCSGHNKTLISCTTCLCRHEWAVFLYIQHSFPHIAFSRMAETLGTQTSIKERTKEYTPHNNGWTSSRKQGYYNNVSLVTSLLSFLFLVLDPCDRLYCCDHFYILYACMYRVEKYCWVGCAQLCMCCFSVVSDTESQ